MSYVNMMDDVRWTNDMHRAEGQRQVREAVGDVDEDVVNRRCWQFLMPLVAALLPPVPGEGPDPFSQVRSALATVVGFCQPLTSDMLGEIVADAAAFVSADNATTAGRADSAVKNPALDYEQQRAALAALPPVPQSGPDPYATQRAALEAEMAAATTTTLNLVASRDAYRATQNPPGDQQ